MFKYFHNETLEIYNVYLEQYKIKNDKDVFELLPPRMLKNLLYTEFNHVCEDRKLALDFEKWLIIFKGVVYN